MSIEREVIVATVVAAAEGRLTSRVRLQKSIYLLDQLGLNTGFKYEYYHYGPYSRGLEIAAADACALDLMKETFDRRGSDGAMYSVYETKNAIEAAAVGGLSEKRIAVLMKLFVETNVTVLELAATIRWLCASEKIKDWKSELKKRKGVKAKEERIAKALDLLKQLKLQPT
jgi:uncharacterized protein